MSLQVVDYFTKVMNKTLKMYNRMMMMMIVMINSKAFFKISLLYFIEQKWYVFYESK